MMIVIVDYDHCFCCIYNGYSHRFVSLLMNVQLMNMIGKQTMSINEQDCISIFFDENLQNESTQFISRKFCRRDLGLHDTIRESIEQHGSS